MKIAVGGIHTECSTYSPLLQTEDDFQVICGTELLKQVGLTRSRFPNADFVPLFHARSIPGGPVSAQCYRTFKADFLKRLEDRMPVDGVLLTMHGAMHVPGLDDVEGDWISAVRNIVGPDVPIAVSYDLHGNVTQKIVDQIDIFCAYRTAPHIDVKETHLRAADNLVDQLGGGQKRAVAWVPVPVLHPGERTSTEDEPAQSIYLQLPEFDKQQGVTDANLMIGYVWADTDRATAAAVVTGTEPKAVAKAAEAIAAQYWTARHEFDFGVPSKALADCLSDAEKASTGPFILADSGDNPTGGGVGDRSDVLHAWLARGLTGGVFAAIADPVATAKAWEAAEGETIPLSIGGAFGSNSPKVLAEFVVGKKTGSAGSRDREAVVHLAGNAIVVTERRRPFHKLDNLRKFGIEPNDARYLIVKSGYLSPELAPIANPARMALTEGAVNQDIPSLTNEKRPTPSYPFQQEFEWVPKSRISERALRLK